MKHRLINIRMFIKKWKVAALIILFNLFKHEFLKAIIKSNILPSFIFICEN